MAHQPPYDIAVHPRFADRPFDELPAWLQRRIERYSVPSEAADDAVVEADEEEDEQVGVDVDESGDPMPVDVDFPHHKGGGYYVLGDGSIVRGADSAEKAEKKLSE